MKKGERSDRVRCVQILMGYPQADGEYTAEFAGYVKKWQAARGLKADGIAGKDTLRRLAFLQGTVSEKRGRRGKAVRALQAGLGMEEADGVFGAKTRQALSEWQQRNGLEADGVCGVMSWALLIAGIRTAKKPPDFKQYAAPWGKSMYSACGDAKQTMANSGCGPTAMADIAAALYEPGITPPELAKRSLAWGTRTKNSGTTAAFFDRCAKEYGAVGYERTTSLNRLIACLDAGGLAAVCVGKSKWTKGGHYLCVWRYDGTRFYINDPASASASRAKGTAEEIKNARKTFCLFYPGKEDNA